MQIDGFRPVVKFCIGLFLEGVLFLMIWDVTMRFNMIDCHMNDTTLIRLRALMLRFHK